MGDQSELIIPECEDCDYTIIVGKKETCIRYKQPGDFIRALGQFMCPSKPTPAVKEMKEKTKGQQKQRKGV